MNKIFLILKREYISRVKKRSFLLTTFLTPLLIGGLYALAIYLAVSDSEEKIVKVIDESGYFSLKLKDRGSIKFEFIDESLADGRENVESGDFTALLYIPELEIDDPQNIKLYAMNTPGMEVVGSVDRALEEVIKSEKMVRLGLKKETLDSLNTDIKVTSINLSGSKEKAGSSSVAMGIGSFSGVLIYMFMLIYGAQVMRGVMQEKTSKIVEILVSSVKPFQLMMGKILGVAGVGLTQFILWFLLTAIVISFAGPLMGDAVTPVVETGQQVAATAPAASNEIIVKIQEVVSTLNIPLLIGAFLFYFLTGYLFYAALFAMIGSAVDSEADTQQFMLPIMLPLIASMMFLGAILKDPSGPLAFWLSIIPFSSPIIMMIRIPFDVPLWQLGLSMVLMVAGFIGTTWMAGRVYRVGILMYGSKVNYKVMAKWLMMKN